MGLSLCKCCCWTKRNRVNQSNKQFKVLLLGQENVGKTEIGYILAGKRRTFYESTNGVQCYEVDFPKYSISVTEIGGNREMQKLWHHYYDKAMGLIYCYDMSASLDELQESFRLLNQIASNPFMSGKAVLLVGTKSDLASDTLQLYDIENEFALEALAKRHFSSLKSIHFNRSEYSNLWAGIDWMAAYLEVNHSRIKGRIKYDTVRDMVRRKANNHPPKRFSLSYRRPKTAPSNLSREIPPPTAVLVNQSTNVFRIADTELKQQTAPQTDELPSPIT